MNKKIKHLLLIILILSAVLTTNVAFTNSNISVTIGGKTIDFPDAKPFIKDGRTLIPVRYVAENLNSEVEWDNKTKTVIITELKVKLNPNFNPPTSMTAIIMPHKQQQTQDGLDLEFFNDNGEYDENGTPYVNMGLFTTAKVSYHYARLYQNQKMENFLDVHVKAFNKIGGIHSEVVYDNLIFP